MRRISALFIDIVFDRIGRLGQIGSSSSPSKILTLGNEIKKSANGAF